MSKQTAVECLKSKISDLVSEYALTTLFEEAKAMEREQIEDAYFDGHSTWGYGRNAEQYYNETYKGGDQ